MKIGHASIDENRKTHGGNAGDQTTKEVCIRDWYNKEWDYVLRCKDRETARKMAEICKILCENNNLGYDQYQRNTLYLDLKKHNWDPTKIDKCETDCSAFMTACAIAAGIKELMYTGNAPTTRNMRNAFMQTGKFELLQDAQHTRTDKNAWVGDIYVKAGSHTVMIVA